MRKFLSLVVFILFLYACKPSVPKEIIQPDKMQKILFDVHIAEGYLTTITNVDSAKKVASSYYNGIYKKFNIDSAIYNKSLNFYYTRPDLLKVIYSNVEKSINEIKINLDKKLNDEELALQLASSDTSINLNGRYLDLKLIKKDSLNNDSLKNRIKENPFGLTFKKL